MTGPDNLIILDTQRKRAHFEPILYSPMHVAEILGISVEQVRKMCREGTIRCIRVGRVVRIHKDDLQSWLDEQRGVL
jgi:excisionase family DNA binding protein